MANKPRRNDHPQGHRYPSHGSVAQSQEQQAIQQVLNEEQIAKTDHIAMEFEADFRPVRDLVLVKIRNPRKTRSGLHLPDGVVAEDAILADVISAGPGLCQWSERDNKMVLVANDFQAGDVVYPMFRLAGQPEQIKIGLNHYLIVCEGELCGFSRKGTAEAHGAELIDTMKGGL